MPDQPAKPRRRTTVGNASSDQLVTELAAPPAGPAPGARPRFEPILPRDENTQRVLSAEVNDWWLTLPLTTRLAVHMEHGEVRS